MLHAQHWNFARLLDYKIMYNLCPVSLYFLTNTSDQYLPLHLMILFAATSAYQANYFIQTITDWNALPT